MRSSRVFQSSVSLLSLAFAAMTAAQPLPSESPRREFWTVDTPVVRGFIVKGVEFVIDESRDRLYIGGGFKHVGPLTGPAAFLNASTGAVNEAATRIDWGTVRAVAPDGAGGWYIGGTFQMINGIQHGGLAHFFSDGSLDVGWDPDANNVVDIEVVGNVLYVAGPDSVGGQPRNGIAAIDIPSGQVLDNWIPWPNGPVSDVEVVGDTVYLAGDFTQVTFQTRPYLAAVNRITGVVLPWSPNPDSGVRTMDSVNGRLYVGGRFTSVGSQPRQIAAAFDVSTGALLPWNPGFVGPDANSIVATSDAIYCGGGFTSVGGQTRIDIAALHPVTAAVLPFAPVISGDEGGTTIVNAVAVSGDKVAFGGHFTSINGQPAHHLAVVTGANGLNVVLGQQAAVDGPNSTQVYAVGIKDDVIAVGGDFHLAGGHRRIRLAALRLSTGKLDPSWNATVAEGSVQAMLLSGSRLYVAGAFNGANGVPRSKVAAFDADTGALINSFNPSEVDGYVTRLALKDNTLYIGGSFFAVGGHTRFHVAALNATTGAVIPGWDGAVGIPSIQSVEDMALSPDQSILYVAGGFEHAGNISTGWTLTGGVAAFDAESGSHRTSLNVDPNSTVYAVLPTDVGAWIGGWFRWFDVPPHSGTSVTRRGIAKVGFGNSAPSPWSMWMDGGGTPNGVHVLRQQAGRLFVGGLFTYLRGSWPGPGPNGGSAPADALFRPYLAAIDEQTSEVLPWNPMPSGEVGELKIGSSVVVVGGGFGSIARKINPFFAVFSVPACPGDANGDGTVNGADLSVLLSNFGGAGQGPEQGDLNGDGVVNGADLSVLLGGFGISCG